MVSLVDWVILLGLVGLMGLVLHFVYLINLLPFFIFDLVNDEFHLFDQP